MRKRDKFFGSRFGKGPSQPAAPQPIPIRPGQQDASLSSNTGPNAAAVSTPTSSNAVAAIQQQRTDTNTSPNAALQLAIEKHLESLPESDKEAFREGAKHITTDSLLSNIRAYDDAHKEKSHFRSRAEGLSQFLSVLDRFMAGVTIAIQANPDPSSLAVGAVRVVLDLAMNFVTFFAKFSTMLCRLGDFLGPLAKYSESSGDQSLILKSLAEVYGDLLQFCQKARRVFVDDAGGLRKWTSWRVFWRVQWLPFEDEFGSIEADMKHHLAVLDHSAQGIVLQTALQMSRSERDRRDREKADEREKLLDWISKIPFEKTHDRIYSQKHPGTGEWLIQTKGFQNWFHSPESALLWCFGKPGAGKSVLMSNVLDYITTERALDEDVGICFAYYDYQNKDLSDVSQIISALIKQLCRKKDNIPAGFAKIKRDSLDPSQLGNLEAFTEISASFKEEIFIIIDALDECPKDNRPQILRFLAQITKTLTHAKVFATSRRAADIEEAFKQLQTPIIKIEAQSIASDISVYVTSETKRLRAGYDGRRLFVKDDALEAMIIETLSNKADGMFLWVNLQLSSLCRVSECRRDSEVRKALQNLPAGLDATYARIFEQICNQEEYMRTIAFKTFRWILYAERPLTVEELQYAITDVESEEFGEDMEVDSIDVILDSCANLLVVDSSLDPHYCTVRPVHFSVPEFLRSLSSANNLARGLINVSEPFLAHAELARICLNHLHTRLSDFNPLAAAGRLYDRLYAFPFLWYAARSFDLHLLHCQPISKTLLQQTLTLIRKSPAFLSSLLEIKAVPSLPGYPPIPAEDRMELEFDDSIIDAGILLFFSRLHEIGDVMSRVQDYKKPELALHYACFLGFVSMVSNLLTSGANVNQKDGNGLTPIYLAAVGGYFQVLEILIKNNADLHTRGGRYGTALQAVSLHENCIGMAELLLKNGADVNSQGGRYETALQAASLSGNSEVVELLLNKGADVNIQGGYFGNALQAASFSGNSEVVELLLENGAGVNIQGGKYGSALGAALSRNHTEIVELLLKNGAIEIIRMDSNIDTKSHIDNN